MNKLLYISLFLAISLSGCRHDSDSPGPDTLVGSWHLTNRMCYCPAGPPPDETLVFDANPHFQLFRAGKLAYEGVYATSQGAVCAGAPSQSLLTLNGAVAAVILSPSGAYTLQNSTLVIDQGSYCLADAVVSTYQRQ